MLSSLAIHLTQRESRRGLTAALSAAAAMLPDMQRPAALLADLNSWHVDRLDEVRYQ